MHIEKINFHKISTKYGDGNVFGQRGQYKTLFLVSMLNSSNQKVWGESYIGIYIPDSIDQIATLISDSLIGLEILNKKDYKSRISIPFVSGSGLFQSTLSAFDLCIWQLRAIELNITLLDLIKSELKKELVRDNSSEKIKFYGSGGSVSFNPYECVRDIEKIKDFGLDGFKMRCGYQSLQKDIERISKVNELIKKDGDTKLMIDKIMGTLRARDNSYSGEDLVKSCIENDFKVFWFEELFDPYNILDYINFKKNKDLKEFTKIALGESFTTKTEFISYANYADFLQLDVTHFGGFTTTIDTINDLNLLNLELDFTVHIWGSCLSFIFNYLLALSCKNIKWVEVPLIELELNKTFIEKDTLFSLRNLKDYEVQNILKTFESIDISKHEYFKNTGYKLPN